MRLDAITRRNRRLRLRTAAHTAGRATHGPCPGRQQSRFRRDRPSSPLGAARLRDRDLSSPAPMTWSRSRCSRRFPLCGTAPSPSCSAPGSSVSSRNTAIDEQRGARHHEQIDENYDGVEQPPDALVRRERIAALVLALKGLPGPQREAILQRELEGRGHGEIARALRLSPGAVRQLIYRARSSLRSAAGAVIPVALVRAACVPGAGEIAGGLGAAGAVKVGLAAVVTTGALVAGASVDRGSDLGTANAVPSPLPERHNTEVGSGRRDVASREDGEDRGHHSGGESSEARAPESGVSGESWLVWRGLERSRGVRARRRRLGHSQFGIVGIVGLQLGTGLRRRGHVGRLRGQRGGHQ